MNNFREEVEKGLGAVVILAGSGSDRAHVKTISEGLVRYGLPVEARVASEHKESDKVGILIREYDSIGKPLAYVVVAGGVDALSGRASWETNNEVFSCPPDHPNLSCINNPPGSSNVYVGKVPNLTRALAQHFAYCNPLCRKVLNEDKAKKLKEQQEADALFREGNFEDPKVVKK